MQVVVLLMITHIFNNQKKFSVEYFKMLRDFGVYDNNMELFHYGKRYGELESMLGEMYYPMYHYWSIFRHIKMFIHLRKSERIIVHSLASPILLCFIWLCPTISDKIYWVIWGKDLYYFHLLKQQKLYHLVYEWLRVKAINKIKHTVSILEEDFVRLEKWYNIKANNIECNNLYPYCVPDIKGSYHDMSDKGATILLGNSASVTNEHLDAINKLVPYINEIDKIICPLSYGGRAAYVKKVIKIGKEKFGDKFLAITEFMPKDQYFKILNNVDIGYFNYNRQEGLGNIWSLMFLKKTIYLKKSTSTAEFFDRIGIKYLSIDKRKEEKLIVLNSEIIETNARILSEYINIDKSIEKWRQILYD